jgi:VanZ family protein
MDSVRLSFRLASAIALMLAIAVLSVLPGHPQPGDSALVWAVAKTPPLVQNIMHVVLYALLSALWVWTLTVVESDRTRPWAVAVTIAIGFGAGLEACQLFVPGRFASIFDVLLNSIGAFGGVLVASRLKVA